MALIPFKDAEPKKTELGENGKTQQLRYEELEEAIFPQEYHPPIEKYIHGCMDIALFAIGVYIVIKVIEWLHL